MLLEVCLQCDKLSLAPIFPVQHTTKCRNVADNFQILIMPCSSSIQSPNKYIRLCKKLRQNGIIAHLDFQTTL